MSTAQAIKAQTTHQDTLLAKSNVVGVGVGFKNAKGATTGELSVVVLVEQKKPLAALSAEDVIPKELDGTRTDVYEVGFLRAYQVPNPPPLPTNPGSPAPNQPNQPLPPPNLPEADPRGRFRPIIPDGVSIGHYKVTAGTLGTMVKDRATGDRLILSNNHVLANGNEAQIGDAILQPGAIDGGEMPGDVIAQLERFIPLRFVDDPPGTMPPMPYPPNPPMPPTLPTNPTDPTNPPPLDPNQPTGPTQPPPNPTNPTNPPLPYPDNSGSPKPTSNPQGCASLLGIIAGIINFIAKLSGAATRVSVTPASAATSSLNAPVGPRSFPASTANIGAGAIVPENRVDCALARPTNPDMFSDEIPHIGIITETKAPTLGMKVRKYGRTSGYTEGTVTLLNATVNVGYSTSAGPRTARLVGQVITEPLSQGGDSGSLIVDTAEDKAVGLLFAGSDLATIFTPIDTVLSALNLTL